ncbi:MAG: type II toxin-antitoxin system RelE/ParE family toxin [Ignisphaera sp.]
MGCSLDIKKSARKFLEKAPKDITNRVSERLQQLAEKPICEEKLKPPLEELCKTRVGSYRVAYLLKPCNIVVVAIGERKLL